ncbi:MAG TPA: hypothetical protein DDY20_03675 [Desulfobulbaceae bacterium]|nr:hypothetical protein [Desulfobulbaceae bacterium]
MHYRHVQSVRFNISPARRIFHAGHVPAVFIFPGSPGCRLHPRSRRRDQNHRI